MKNFPKNILISLTLAIALSAAGCEVRVHPQTEPAYTYDHGAVYYDYHHNSWDYADDCYYDEDMYQQYGYYYYCETVYCYDYHYNEYYIWDEDCWFVD